MNAPKFKIGDKVVFSREIKGKQYVVRGTVYTVDECGTFEQDEEPTYDVMSVGLDGQECLYIHIRESQCLKCHRFTKNSISVICENAPKFKIGDKVRISSDIEFYYKYDMRAQHWTLSINSVAIDMLKYAGCVATIEADGLYGYILDIDGNNWRWSSELLTLVEDEEKIPESEEGGETEESVAEIPELEEDKTSSPDFQANLKNRIENIVGKISDRMFAFILEASKDIPMDDLCLWHTMDEEPLESGVILFSDKTNRIYDGSYIGDGRFEINGLVVNKNNFDCWCQRLDFFKKTNLRNYLR